MLPNVSLQYRETNSTSGMCSAKATTRSRGLPCRRRQAQLCVLAACLPELVHYSCAPNTEGAGNAGCDRRTRGLVCKKKAHELVTTGMPKRSGIPRAMVLTAASCSPWRAGLDSHHHRRDHCSRRLDSSVGESGPHDLAVRARAARRATRSRPPLPAATSVTTRTSLRSRRDGRMRTIISDIRKYKF